MVVPQLTSVQPIRRAAFQGEAGAFSEEAAQAMWPGVIGVPAHTVADVARAVASGMVDAGVLPVENTVAGAVDAAYDALVGEPDLCAVAEAVLQIRQFLMAPVGATLDGIEVVESHPVALAQCSAFLSGLPGIREQASFDTAGAARAVAESRDVHRAAIASRHAAARHGLAILAEHIENRPDNQTRFLGIARTPADVRPGSPARTSLVFTTADAPGALVCALEPIARLGLNLSRLESRPTGEPWTYRFFADIDHPAGHPPLYEALAILTATTASCRIIGTYARALS
jgi:prephenate dehydratase